MHATAPMISLANDMLSVDISTFGAELWRLRDAEDRDLLWDGDPAFWTGRAPLLFPVVGALRDDRYRYDGRSYAMPKHGFARRKPFAVVEAGTQAALLRLEADDETRAAYPFEFRLDMHFELDGATLATRASLTNLGDRSMPASFGYHPALRWPLPYGRPRDAHRLRFEQAEPDPIRRIDDTGLVGPAPHQTPVAGDMLLLEDALFENDAVIFDRLRSHSLVYCADEGPAIEIAFPDMPHLGVWTKPGAGYICIEPWQGHADLSGFDGDIRDKTGIVEIAPGEARTFTMRLRLLG